jgi:hypothetical protein
MSVINKMLRDLDHRQGTQTPVAAVGVPPHETPLRRGTASVAVDRAGGQQKFAGSTGRWLGLGFLVCVALSLGGWLWLQADTASQRVEVATVPSTAPVAPTSIAAPEAAPVVTVNVTESPLPAAAEPTTMQLRMESSLSARKALDALLTTAPSSMARAPAPPAATAPPPAATSAPAQTPVRTIAATDRTPARTAVAPTVAPPASATDNTASLQRQQQAGGDAIAQAQGLWNSGSRDAAMELIQQSITAAERGAKTGTSTVASPLLLPLVRELTRMQLSEGRFGAVWELLTRLEPQLAGQPDLWAIRANAAQRLGRHQDSVHAYMVALQSRPDEQRWLLGTAVSLAALGQTSSAAEMAEKARAVGPVGKDILTYLRQAGVPLRDQ